MQRRKRTRARDASALGKRSACVSTDPRLFQQLALLQHALGKREQQFRLSAAVLRGDATHDRVRMPLIDRTPVNDHFRTRARRLVRACQGTHGSW